MIPELIYHILLFGFGFLFGTAVGMLLNDLQYPK